MKVAIAGTNGLACSIAHYIQYSFHSCILLTRHASHPLSSTYTMMTVNYKDENGLIYTLSGVDLVISFVTGDDQLLLIDSALKAGVTRFVPSEFGVSPESRGQYATLDRGQRLAQIRLRDHVAEGMEYTLILCGILYERLGPGGLVSANIGNLQGPNREGDFLMDIRAMTAQIPHDRVGTPAQLCLSSAQDLARAIVAALDVPNWPRIFRFRGERMSTLDVVKIAERFRETRFERAEHSIASLQSSLRLAQSSANVMEQQRVSLLLAISGGAFDFAEANLNNVIRFRPTRLSTWLQSVWRPAL